MTSTPLLALRAVSKTYDSEGGGAVLALRSVTLDVERGAHVAVVGQSGCGKSTLLNVLGLLDHPTAGTYLVDGVDVAEVPDRLRGAMRAQVFGFVFQAFHLLPHISVLANVELGMLYRPVDRGGRRRRSVELLDRVGLAERRTVSPSTLSGGQRQRVAIARALVGQPSVLLCDEPTGNLDSVTSQAVLDLLDEINAEGTAVVTVTHSAAVADRARTLVEIADGAVCSVSEAGGERTPP